MRALDVLELIAYVQAPVSSVCFPSSRLLPLYFSVLITVQRIHYTAVAALHQAKVVCQLATTLAMASPPSESYQRFDPHYKVYVNPVGKYVKKVSRVSSFLQMRFVLRVFSAHFEHFLVDFTLPFCDCQIEFGSLMKRCVLFLLHSPHAIDELGGCALLMLVVSCFLCIACCYLALFKPQTIYL